MIQELCLVRGFRKEQAAEAIAVLAQGGGDFKTTFAPMTDEMLGQKMEEILDALFKGESPAGKGLTEGIRVVLMAVPSQERALAIMRAVKSVSENPGDIVFAMVTQTALTWTLQEYIDHVSAEHEYMKTHNPADDPDMKRIK